MNKVKQSFTCMPIMSNDYKHRLHGILRKQRKGHRNGWVSPKDLLDYFWQWASEEGSVALGTVNYITNQCGRFISRVKPVREGNCRAKCPRWTGTGSLLFSSLLFSSLMLSCSIGFLFIGVLAWALWSMKKFNKSLIQAYLSLSIGSYLWKRAH